MDIEWLIAIEERLNSPLLLRANAPDTGRVLSKVDDKFIDKINKKLEENPPRAETTLYEDVVACIGRLDDLRFKRPAGGIKEAAFYSYALIDKSTWSALKWNQIRPSKKTLLKLVIALRLDMEQATALLAKGREAFDKKDFQDRVIMALIDLKCYDINEVIEILDFYRENGPQAFDSIYDTPEMIAERKRLKNKKG